METQLLLILIGAAGGILSSYLIEIFRNRNTEKRLKEERENTLEAAKEKNIRDFFTTASAENRSLAWIKLVKTPKPNLVRESIDARLVARFTQPANRQKTIELSEEAVKRNLKILGSKNLKVIQKYILLSMQIIGRDDACEICIPDKTISRRHALIRYQNGDYVINDLGSASGTYVNEIEVSEAGAVLDNLDTIIIGESIFIFEDRDSGVLVTKPKPKRKKR